MHLAATLAAVGAGAVQSALGHSEHAVWQYRRTYGALARFYRL
jgi:hypothetical protein